jgi:hypothetical protein
MHRPIHEHGKWLKQVVDGYFRYHAVSTNSHALKQRRFTALYDHINVELLRDAFSGMTRMRNSSLCVLGLHGFRGELGLRGDERHLGRDCDIAISIEHDMAPELTFPACSVAVHTRDVGHAKHLAAARKYLTDHWHGPFHDAAALS